MTLTKNKTFHAVIVNNVVRAIFRHHGEAFDFARQVRGEIVGWRIPAETFEFEE